MDTIIKFSFNLHLFIVVAVLSNENNLALGRPARQGSLGHWDGTPNHAVDGGHNGDFLRGHSCTHTADNTNNPWWAVDLGSTCTIGKVKIYNRVDSKFSVKRDISICTDS